MSNNHCVSIIPSLRPMTCDHAPVEKFMRTTMSPALSVLLLFGGKEKLLNLQY